MRRQRARRERGFTMIELLITMLLLSISLTGLAALQIHAIRQTTATRRSNEATRVGQDVIERRLLGALPATAAWGIESNRAGAFMQNVGADGVSVGPYTVESKIELGPTANDRLITVRVSWRDVDAKAAGQHRMIYMTTMRTQN
jgi:prepilin-type N-terminal cleavage/methylation domain-containing protein